MKVLLLAATGEEPSFRAWKAALHGAMMPFDSIVLVPSDAAGQGPARVALTDGSRHARYQALILATGDLIYGDGGAVMGRAQRDALRDFARRFGVRQLTAYAYPSVECGLHLPSGAGELGGITGELTAAGAEVFPYLRGPVPLDPGSYGYAAAPLAAQATGASFETLIEGPRGSALLGVYRHPDGREEMVQTFDANAEQIQSQLLRSGQLAWVTRGVYLGLTRNYLPLHVDDVFLANHSWNVETHTADRRPADLLRMTEEDVAHAVSWSRARGLRLDLAFNGGASERHRRELGSSSDPLLDAFAAQREAFGWINHTFEHALLDDASQALIEREIERNLRWATEHGLAVEMAALITGEHSGLANLVPRPLAVPELRSVSARDGGALEPGGYEYAVTATSSAGETPPALTAVLVSTAPGGAVELVWRAVPRARGYNVYRRERRAEATWSRLASLEQPDEAAAGDLGALVTFIDEGASAGTFASPPSENSAAIEPHGQNPHLLAALRSQGVRYLACDASKPYPLDPRDPSGPSRPAGTPFTEDGVLAIPRLPISLPYDAATQAQVLDQQATRAAEGGADGGELGWDEFLDAEARRIFDVILTNDPYPHFFHQSNLCQSQRPGGAVAYALLDRALALYGTYFEDAPLLQPSFSAIGELLTRREAWRAALEADTIGGYVEGSTVTIVNRSDAPIEAPLSGAEIGERYGGVRSGWLRAAPGESAHPIEGERDWHAAGLGPVGPSR